MSSHCSELAAKPDQRKIELLVIEDNDADVWLVEEALAVCKISASLHLIQDGANAIGYIEQTDVNPDSVCPELVLLDLNLPKKSGRDVLRCLRSSQKCKDIPVVIMTSSDSQKDRAELIELGATLYFRKPPDYKAFMQIGNAINQLLNN